jgi:TRAP-type transport system periplasmic protein
MKNRRSAFVVLAGFLLVMCNASIASSIDIKLGHIWALDHPLHKGALKFAADVDKATNGSVKIQVFPASQLGSETQQWEAVATGLQHMTIGASGFKWDSRFTLPDVPYAIRDMNHLKKFHDSPVWQELTGALIQKAGIRILGNWYQGTRELTTSKKAVRTPADMKGFKLRIPDLEAHRVAWAAIGAHPTPIAFGETYMALSTGTVDGQENPIASIGAMKFYEVQKYLVLTHHVVQVVNVTVNERFYQGLPADVQKLLVKVAADTAIYEEGLQYEAENNWMKAFKERGVEVIEPDRAAFKKAASTVGSFFTEKYKWGDLWDRVQALQ